MCPVRALCRYRKVLEELAITEGVQHGENPAFVKKFHTDGKGTVRLRMEYDQFAKLFKNHLKDIGRPFSLYGSHSFRRGGCQFFNQVLNWPVVDIVAYGGWSLQDQNIVVLYLNGANDLKSCRSVFQPPIQVQYETNH